MAEQMPDMAGEARHKMDHGWESTQNRGHVCAVEREGDGTFSGG